MLGKPYKHKGRGPDFYDCLGVILEYYNLPDPKISYSPHWDDPINLNIEQYIQEYFIKVDKFKPNDLILFQMGENTPPKHMAVYVEKDIILHAYWGRAVTKSFLNPFWGKRIRSIWRLK